VKGTPITEYCDRHRLTTRDRLQLFMDVCHAVQHAHLKGIIHRDIKPSNVLVEIHDVKPVVKVIDFGIAKATGQQLTDKTLYTGVAQMVGTPLYMSPEQAGLSSLDVDTRSDVYSLGVLLYELLTGTTPFDNETLKKADYDEMRRIIREDEPPRPSARLSTMQQAHISTIAEQRGLEPRHLSQHLRGELDWIVMRALEKDRNRRYESASAFAADVQRFLNDEPVQACPPSLAYRFRKFARRKKAVLTVTISIAAALLAGTAISLWQAVEANAARTVANQRLDRETEARRDADASFKKSLEAVDRMLTRVSDEKLSAIPQMKELRKRLLEDAAAFYTDLIALNPKNGWVYCERFLVYDRLDQREKVLPDYEKAVELDPENEEFQVALATWLIWAPIAGMQDMKRGLEHAKRASELADLHGNLPSANRLRFSRGDCAQPAKSHLCLGRAYQTLEYEDKAVAAFRKAAKTAPADSADAHYCLAHAESVLGNNREALAHYQKAHELAPSGPWYLANIAASHHSLGEDDKALAVIEQGLKWDAILTLDRASLHATRAAIYANRSEHKSALEEYSKAIELHAWQYTERAGLHFRLNHLEEALADYDKFLATYPLQWHVYKRRAKVHFRLKHYEKALADLAKALELRPDDVSTLRWITPMELALCPDEGFRNGVLALADRTIAVLSGNPEIREGAESDAYAVRASLYAAMKQPDKSKADIEKAVALGVTWEIARFVLLEIFIGWDRPSDCLPILESGLESLKAKQGVDHPDTLGAMNTLGVWYWQAKKFDKSIPLFEELVKLEAKKLGKDDPLTLRDMANLAINYRAAGRLQDAHRLLEEAAERAKKLKPVPASFAWIEDELAKTRAKLAPKVEPEPVPSPQELPPK
jgi:tetratricopeptide (TPR) repeat protein